MRKEIRIISFLIFQSYRYKRNIVFFAFQTHTEIELLLAFEWRFVGIKVCFSLTFFKNKLFKFPRYSNNNEDEGFLHELFPGSELWIFS